MNYPELLAAHDALRAAIISAGCEIRTDEHGVTVVVNTRAEQVTQRIENMKQSGMAMLEHEMQRTRECLELREKNATLIKALQEIAAISDPQMCMDGSAIVGSKDAIAYDFQHIARTALK